MLCIGSVNGGITSDAVVNQRIGGVAMGSNGKRPATVASVDTSDSGLEDGNSTTPISPYVNSFLAAVNGALAAADIREARSLIAAEEEKQRSASADDNVLEFSDLVTAKVRVALATDDGEAAHAILVAAIEAAPENRALRVLMSEVMLAIGRAADVRPVLRHIGRPSPSDETDTRRAGDTSG